MQAIVFGLFCLLFVACGAATPQLIQCKLDALNVLPDDPRNATVADAVDVIGRIKACHGETPDAGQP